MVFSTDVYEQISTAIEALEQDERLSAPENFVERIKAIDFLELQKLDELGQQSHAPEAGADHPSLLQRVAALEKRLNDANEKLFDRLSASIRSNDRAALKEFIKQVEQQTFSRGNDEIIGYDELDALITGLLAVAVVPEAPPQRDPDFIYYQPTPVRIVLKLIDELHPARDDVFYDLGSGLGHVPILVNLLAGIEAKGVELEEPYCQYAEACLKKLGLSGVAFIQADARHAAYDDGTIFYLYTPFQGKVLAQVLGKLEAQARRRPITVCTYGPCTLQIEKQGWLKPTYRIGKEEGSLGIFGSF